MKMKVFALALGLLLVSASPILAHSGRTDSSGCHNCNVGSCAGTYHCHNGGYAPAPVYVAPVATIKPATPKPTIKPTIAPTPTATPTITPTITPTATPQVQGASTSDGSSVLGGLVGMGVLLGGGYFGLKWLGRVTAPKEEA